MKKLRRQLKARAKRRFSQIEQLEDRRLLAYAPVDVNPHHNYLFASDVSNDGDVSPRDALMLVNDLNANGARDLTSDDPSNVKLDVNDDGYASPSDVLFVINALNGGDGEDQPIVEYTYGVADQFNQDRANNAFSVGEVFRVNYFVEDIRNSVRGLASAYLDMNFSDRSLFEPVVGEKQTLTIEDQRARTGTFTLSFGGETTGGIDIFNTGQDVASIIQTQLETLSSISPGDVEVLYTPFDDPDDDTQDRFLRWSVRFIGDYAGMEVDELLVMNTTGVLDRDDVSIGNTEGTDWSVSELEKFDSNAAFKSAFVPDNEFKIQTKLVNEESDRFENVGGFEIITDSVPFNDPVQLVGYTLMRAVNKGQLDLSASIPAPDIDEQEDDSVGAEIIFRGSSVDLRDTMANQIDFSRALATVIITQEVNAVDDNLTTDSTGNPLLEDPAQGVEYVLNVLANDFLEDPGAGGSLQLVADGLSGTAADEGRLRVLNNQLLYRPGPDFNGQETFSYTVTDGLNHFDQADVTVTIAEVNDPPTATDVNKNTPEDTQLVFPIADLLAGATTGPANEDGQSLTAQSVGITTAPQHGTVQLVGENVVYTPTTMDYNGPDSFSFTLVDNGTTNGQPDPLPVTGNVFVTIDPVNDPPVANDDSDETAEDNALTINISDLLANDSAGPDNESGQALTIEILTDPSHGTLERNGDVLTYTPAEHYNGTDSFTYQLIDNNGPTELTDQATVNLTITEVNDDPVAVTDTNITVFQNTDSQPSVLNLPGDEFGAVTDNDETGPTPADPATVDDESGQTLTITSVQTTSDQGGSVVLNQDGSITYTPPIDYLGSDSFTYTIQDDGLTDGNSDPKSDTGVVQIEVIPRHIPGAVPDNFTDPGETMPEGSTAIYDVLLNDIRSGNVGEELTITAIEDISNATLTYVDSNGNPLTLSTDFEGFIQVAPIDFFNGTLVFTYDIEDNDPTTDEINPKTGTTGDQTTVTVRVTEVNDAPTANDDSFDLTEDIVRIFSPAELTGNDLQGADLDGVFGEKEQSLTVTAVSVPNGSGASVRILENGNIEYTPAQDYVGDATFTYTITDDGTTNGVDDFLSDSATVDLTIAAVNDAPVAVNDFLSTNEDTPLVIDWEDEIVNNDDQPKKPGEENETLTVISVGPANFGSAVLDNGTITYTPPQDFVGTASFTYTIEDDGVGNLQGTATIEITVDPVNDAPIPAETSGILVLKADVGGTQTITPVLGQPGPATAVDEVNQTLRIANPQVSVGMGTISNVTDTSFDFTPQTGFLGDISFTYDLVDSGPGGAPNINTAQGTVTGEVVDAIPSDVSGFLYIDSDNDGEYDEAEPYDDANNSGAWEEGESFTDYNGNNIRDYGELKIGGVDVSISGRTIQGGIYSTTVTTGHDGNYIFEDVLPSITETTDPGYSISSNTPMFMLDGKDTIGDQGGTTGNDLLSNIKLDIFGQGNDGRPAATNNTFGELGVDSRFITLAELFSTSSHDGFMVATDMSGDDRYWFSILDGWDSMTDVEITNVETVAGKPDKVIGITFQATMNGQQRTRTISAGDQYWKHFRVMGYAPGQGYVFRVDGTAAELGLASNQGGEGEGEGEAMTEEQYQEAVDSVFQGKAWA